MRVRIQFDKGLKGTMHTEQSKLESILAQFAAIGVNLRIPDPSYTDTNVLVSRQARALGIPRENAHKAHALCVKIREESRETDRAIADCEDVA
jgi:hypothetical protein